MATPNLTDFPLTEEEHARFLSKFPSGLPEDQCWDWPNAKFSTGYGLFSLRGCPFGAHRLAWVVFVGPIPDGLWVLHRCDRPICVNWKSCLFLGTPGDNARDRNAKGRTAHGPEHAAKVRATTARGERWHAITKRIHKGEDHPNHLRPERLKRGSEHYAAKLTEADVLVIRKRYAAGESPHDIAKDYPVVTKVLTDAIRRHTWKHVP